MTELQSIEYRSTLTQPEKKGLQLEFIGDSITVGDGMLWKSGSNDYVLNQNTMLGYAAKTAAKLNADFSMIAHSGITTAGMLTSPQSYVKANEEFALNSSGKQVVVINLGTNDIGLPETCDTDALKTAIGQ